MLNIFIKEIKQSIRNKNELIIRLLFPLFLMFILGTVFSSFFSDDSFNIEAIDVLYNIEENSMIGQSFNSFINNNDTELRFEKARSKKEALEIIKDNDYPCYIKISDGKIDIYFGTKDSIKSTYIKSIINVFADKYQLGTAIFKINSNSDPSILLSSHDKASTNIVTLTRNKQARAIDYYSITMLTLIIMYSATWSIYQVKDEIYLYTLERILKSPLPINQLFLGKLLSSIFITLLQIVIILVTSITVFKVNWADSIPIILVVLISQVIMCSSIGIGLGFIESKHSPASIISVLIPIMVFLGGGYFPLESFNQTILTKISIISPVKWINEAIFQSVYKGSYGAVFISLAINLGISLIFLLLTISKLKRLEDN